MSTIAPHFTNLAINFIEGQTDRKIQIAEQSAQPIFTETLPDGRSVHILSLDIPLNPSLWLLQYQIDNQAPTHTRLKIGGQNVHTIDISEEADPALYAALNNNHPKFFQLRNQGLEQAPVLTI